MSVNLLLMLLALVCGWQAVRAKSLLTAALWLAGVSALVALAMYGVGAAETAVIELSVGAGLVTILFVFAITIAGDEAMTAPSIIPKLLRWLLLVGILAGLGWFILPVEQVAVLGDEVPFTAVLGGGFGHFYAYAPEKLEYPINRFAMEVKRQLDVLDRNLAARRFLDGDEYTIADVATYPWYGGLVLHDLYGAETFLDVKSYTHVVRWASEIQDRPAVRRGQRVNKAWGPEEERVPERHSASDLD
jgi:uncharacterized MnhB-related membrane protein